MVNLEFTQLVKNLANTGIQLHHCITIPYTQQQQHQSTLVSYQYEYRFTFTRIPESKKETR